MLVPTNNRFARAAHAGVQAGSELARLTPAGPDDYPQYLGPLRLAAVPGVRLDPDWVAQQSPGSA